MKNELDALRPRHHPNKFLFTKEQDEALLFARDSPNPVYWNRLVDYFQKKWGISVTTPTLRTRFTELKKSTPGKVK